MPPTNHHHTTPTASVRKRGRPRKSPPTTTTTAPAAATTTPRRRRGRPPWVGLSNQPKKKKIRKNIVKSDTHDAVIDPPIAMIQSNERLLDVDASVVSTTIATAAITTNTTSALSLSHLPNSSVAAATTTSSVAIATTTLSVAAATISSVAANAVTIAAAAAVSVSGITTTTSLSASPASIKSASATTTSVAAPAVNIDTAAADTASGITNTTTALSASPSSVRPASVTSPNVTTTAAGIIATNKTTVSSSPSSVKAVAAATTNATTAPTKPSSMTAPTMTKDAVTTSSVAAPSVTAAASVAGETSTSSTTLNSSSPSSVRTVTAATTNATMKPSSITTPTMTKDAATTSSVAAPAGAAAASSVPAGTTSTNLTILSSSPSSARFVPATTNAATATAKPLSITTPTMTKDAATTSSAVAPAVTAAAAASVAARTASTNSTSLSSSVRSIAANTIVPTVATKPSSITTPAMTKDAATTSSVAAPAGTTNSTTSPSSPSSVRATTNATTKPSSITTPNMTKDAATTPSVAAPAGTATSTNSTTLSSSPSSVRTVAATANATTKPSPITTPTMIKDFATNSSAAAPAVTADGTTSINSTTLSSSPSSVRSVAATTNATTTATKPSSIATVTMTELMMRAKIEKGIFYANRSHPNSAMIMSAMDRNDDINEGLPTTTSPTEAATITSIKRQRGRPRLSDHEKEKRNQKNMKIHKGSSPAIAAAATTTPIKRPRGRPRLSDQEKEKRSSSVSTPAVTSTRGASAAISTVATTTASSLSRSPMRPANATTTSSVASPVITTAAASRITTPLSSTLSKTSAFHITSTVTDPAVTATTAGIKTTNSTTLSPLSSVRSIADATNTTTKPSPMTSTTMTKDGATTASVIARAVSTTSAATATGIAATKTPALSSSPSSVRSVAATTVRTTSTNQSSITEPTPTVMTSKTEKGIVNANQSDPNNVMDTMMTDQNDDKSKKQIAVVTAQKGVSTEMKIVDDSTQRQQHQQQQAAILETATTTVTATTLVGITRPTIEGTRVMTSEFTSKVNDDKVEVRESLSPIVEAAEAKKAASLFVTTMDDQDDRIQELIRTGSTTQTNKGITTTSASITTKATERDEYTVVLSVGTIKASTTKAAVAESEQRETVKLMTMVSKTKQIDSFADRAILSGGEGNLQEIVAKTAATTMGTAVSATGTNEKKTGILLSPVQEGIIEPSTERTTSKEGNENTSSSSLKDDVAVVPNIDLNKNRDNNKDDKDKVVDDDNLNDKDRFNMILRQIQSSLQRSHDKVVRIANENHAKKVRRGMSVQNLGHNPNNSSSSNSSMSSNCHMEIMDVSVREKKELLKVQTEVVKIVNNEGCDHSSNDDELDHNISNNQNNSSRNNMESRNHTKIHQQLMKLRSMLQNNQGLRNDNKTRNCHGNDIHTKNTTIDSGIIIKKEDIDDNNKNNDDGMDSKNNNNIGDTAESKVSNNKMVLEQLLEILTIVKQEEQYIDSIEDGNEADGQRKADNDDTIINAETTLTMATDMPSLSSQDDKQGNQNSYSQSHHNPSSVNIGININNDKMIKNHDDDLTADTKTKNDAVGASTNDAKMDTMPIISTDDLGLQQVKPSVTMAPTSTKASVTTDTSVSIGQEKKKDNDHPNRNEINELFGFLAPSPRHHQSNRNSNGIQNIQNVSPIKEGLIQQQSEKLHPTSQSPPSSVLATLASMTTTPTTVDCDTPTTAAVSANVRTAVSPRTSTPTSKNGPSPTPLENMIDGLFNSFDDSNENTTKQNISSASPSTLKKSLLKGTSASTVSKDNNKKAGAYFPKQAFLSSDEIEELSNEIWFEIGRDSNNNVDNKMNNKVVTDNPDVMKPTTKALEEVATTTCTISPTITLPPHFDVPSYKIATEYFRRNGYLHFDEDDYHTTMATMTTNIVAANNNAVEDDDGTIEKEKKQYLQRATKEQIRQLQNLDSMAIALAIGLCDGRNKNRENDHVKGSNDSNSSGIEIEQTNPPHDVVDNSMDHMVLVNDQSVDVQEISNESNSMSVSSDQMLPIRLSLTSSLIETPYIPHQVFLSNDEVEELANEVWDQMGASCLLSNDVFSTKYGITREYFRQKGYLYLDAPSPSTAINSSSNNENLSKLQYIKNAKPSEKQHLKSLDSRSIAWAAALFDTKNHEKHSSMITTLNSSSDVLDDADSNTIPLKEVVVATSARGSTIVDGSPLHTSKQQPSQEIKIDDNIQHIPRQVELKQEDIAELAKMIQDAVLGTKLPNDKSLIRQLTYNATRDYFRQNGYLHVDPTSCIPFKKELLVNATAEERQRMTQLDECGIASAMVLCDRWKPQILPPASTGLLQSQENRMSDKMSSTNKASGIEVNELNLTVNSIHETIPADSVTQSLDPTIHILSVVNNDYKPTKPFTPVERQSFIQAREDEIYEAVDVIGKSLSMGAWPSPYHSFEPDQIRTRYETMTLSDLLDDDELVGDDILEDLGSNNNTIDQSLNSDFQQHMDHFFVVIASLKQFAQDVIRPKIIEDLNTAIAEANDHRRIGYDNGPNHILLSTLIMLRELMAQNVIEIFGRTSILMGDEDEFLPLHLRGHGNHNSKGDDVLTSNETAIFTAKILPTAVILAGLSEVKNDSDHLANQFLELATKYDRGDDSFADQARVADDNMIGVFPTDQPLSDQELIAWRLSSNYNRERHPVVRENEKTKQLRKVDQTNDFSSKKRKYQPVSIALAEADTVHISILTL